MENDLLFDLIVWRNEKKLFKEVPCIVKKRSSSRKLQLLVFQEFGSTHSQTIDTKRNNKYRKKIRENNDK